MGTTRACLLVGIVGAVALVLGPSALASGGTVLHDQYDNPGTTSTSSQNYEDSLASYDDEAADDFVISNEYTGWIIDRIEVQGEYYGSGPATSVNVRIYLAGAGALPSTLVVERVNQPFTNGPNFVIDFSWSDSIAIVSETYWLSVQANQDFQLAGGWRWTDRTVQTTSGSAWQNPGGGQGTGCPAWQRRTSCLGNPTAPDQVWRLSGGYELASPPPQPPPPEPPPEPPPPGPPCIVPRVIGLKLARARAKIEAADCDVGRTRRVPFRKVGRVAAQSPRAGAVRGYLFDVKLMVGRR